MLLLLLKLMNSFYFTFFIISFILSVLLTPYIIRLAYRLKAIDNPNERKIHQKPIARLGGVAIILAFLFTLFIVYIVDSSKLEFTMDKIWLIDKNLFGVFLGILILLIIGVWDDIKGLNPGIKLIFHFIAALIVVAFGVNIWWIRNPFTNLDIILGNWTYLIVPLWIVLLINVTNWLDGVDGLATGIGIIASIVLFFLSISHEVNQSSTGLLAIVLAGSLLGFLIYNFNPAKIFLGDSGSMFIGFMLAIFAIISGGKMATAALVLGLPILDAFWVIIRRIISGKSPWTADRLHLHHRFLDVGFSQRQTVFMLYGISALFGVVALSAKTKEKLILSFWLIAIMFVIASILVKLKKVKNNEKAN